MTDLRSQLQATLGDGYTLERELGGGGMSRVFVARENALGRDVVVKVLAPELAASVSAERFTREIATAARLQQANIVPVLSAGTSGGVSYYTMPFVKGESLRAQLARGVNLSVHDRINVLRDVARALAYAHGEGVIHRDIKPDNILLSAGTAVVTDFGIAKAISASRTLDGAAPRDDNGTLTQVGSSIGTPAYMAPEQAVGETVDARVDLYAWGVVAYELLSGAHPFAGKTGTSQLIAAHIAETPRALDVIAPHVPREVNALVMQCLEKHPAQRPADATALLAGLRTITTLGTERSAQRTLSTPRAPWLKIAIPVAAVALAAVAVWTTRTRSSSDATLDRSVIVLPFDNTSRDTTQEYFADGLTDELIGRLASAGLRVSGRNTAFAFKGKHPTPREVGKIADVATVLSGQVRRLGDQFHVTAELSNAANDAVLWTYSKDSRTADAFALQRELVDSIIARFALASKAAASSDATDASVSPQAHDFVLRGKFAANHMTLDGWTEAVALYDSALTLAPRYVDAYLGKADAISWIGDSYESPRTVLPRVQAIFAQVAKIDSLRADYWAMQASRNAFWLFDWPNVRRDAARARAVEPLSFYAVYADALARLADGNGMAFAATLDTVQRVDPLSPIPPLQRIWFYGLSGMRDSTRAVWQRIPAYLRPVDNGDVTEGMVLLALDKPADAERAFRDGEDALGHPSALRVVALARLGRTAEARTQLQRVEQAFAQRYFPPEMIAAGAAELGDTTAMYRWLDVGQRERSTFALNLGYWDRPFVAHRQEPHFQRILKQVGLSPVRFGTSAAQ